MRPRAWPAHRCRRGRKNQKEDREKAAVVGRTMVPSMIFSSRDMGPIFSSRSDASCKGGRRARSGVRRGRPDWMLPGLIGPGARRPQLLHPRVPPLGQGRGQRTGFQEVKQAVQSSVLGASLRDPSP